MTKTITIRIRANKSGKPVAHYWGAAKRWLPLSVAAAELALATGTIYGAKAVRVESTADPLPVGYVHTSIDGNIWN